MAFNDVKTSGPLPTDGHSRSTPRSTTNENRTFNAAPSRPLSTFESIHSNLNLNQPEIRSVSVNST